MEQMKRKGQQEMLGFAFVVMLIVIVGFIFLVISLNSESTTVERESPRVNNLLNGIMYYTTDCDEKSVQRLLLECNAPRGGGICSGGDVSVCDSAYETIGMILENSLIREDYVFSFERVGSGELVNSEAFPIITKEGQEDCPGRRVAFTASSVLPGSIKVKLITCPLHDSPDVVV